MTLRPIEPIDIRTLTPQEPPSCMPIFEQVDPRTLRVDPAYQRNLGEKGMRQIRRIIEKFDWTRFKPPVCAYAEDENGDIFLKVIDGQHTATAAASNPHVPSIPVMIVDAPDVQAQAQAFIGQNTDRLGVTATQMHVAALAAGDADAQAMADLCNSVGIVIRKNPPSNGGPYAAGETVAVTAVSVLFRKEGAEHAGNVLRICSDAQLAPIKADHIKAVDALLGDPQYGALDPDALAAHIRAIGPVALKEASVFASTHSVPVWRGLASVWFQKAKRRKSMSTVTTKVVGNPPSDDEAFARDTREAKGAWASGNHVRRCVKCDAAFRGGRLALECAPCAYGAVS